MSRAKQLLRFSFLFLLTCVFVNYAEKALVHFFSLPAQGEPVAACGYGNVPPSGHVRALWREDVDFKVRNALYCGEHDPFCNSWRHEALRFLVREHNQYPFRVWRPRQQELIDGRRRVHQIRPVELAEQTF